MLAFIFFLITLLAAGLYHGFTIDQLDLGPFEADRLYIKIDKKLIIRAQRFVYHGGMEEGSSLDRETVVTLLRRSFTLLDFVREVDVKNFYAAGEKFTLHYENFTFLIESSMGSLNGRMAFMEPKLSLDVENLTLKEQNTTLSGQILYDLGDDDYRASVAVKNPHFSGLADFAGTREKVTAYIHEGVFHYKKNRAELSGKAEIDLESFTGTFTGDADGLGINAKIHGELAGDQLELTVHHATATSLEKLVQVLPTNQDAKVWIHGRTQAARYYLEYLYAKINVKTGHLDERSFRLSGTANDAVIHFHPDLPPATAAKIDVAIEENRLTIQGHGASYQGNDAKVRVEIGDLFDRTALLRLQLQTPALLNREIRRVLAAFKVKLGFEQTEGVNDTLLQVAIKLFGMETEILSRTRVKEGRFTLLGGKELVLKKGTVRVDGADVFLEDMDARFDNLARFRLSGTLDTQTNRMDGKGLLTDLDIGVPLLLDMKPVATSVVAETGKTLDIILPDLKARLHLPEKGFSLRMDDVSLFKEYSTLLRYFAVDGGTLDLAGDGENLRALFDLNSSRPVLFKNGEPIRRVRGQYEENGEAGTVRVGDFATATIQKNGVKIGYDGVDLDVTKLVEMLKRKTTLDDSMSREEKSFSLSATDSALIWNERTLPTDWYSLYRQGESGEVTIKYKKNLLHLSQNRNDLTLRGQGLDADLINRLLDARMTRGTMDVTAYANLNNKDLYGVLTIKDTTIREMQAVNNIIAFIHTIPSLVQLKNPGFSTEGYDIKKGVIEFYYTGDTLFFNSIRLVGVNTDIIGYGSVNLADDTIDMVLTVQTVKNLSNIIGKIPFFGYVLLDESRDIGTILRVTGKVDKPKVITTLAQDVATYPLQLIRRTIQWPLQLFQDEEDPGK